MKKQHRASDDLFAALVMQSPGTTKLVFEQQFVEFKKKDPHATNKQIFEAILQWRYFTNYVSEGMSPGAAREQLQSGLTQSFIQMALENIENLHNLIRYIVEEYEQFWLHTPDPLGVNTRIAEILGYHRQASDIERDKQEGQKLAQVQDRLSELPGALSTRDYQEIYEGLRHESAKRRWATIKKYGERPEVDMRVQMQLSLLKNLDEQAYVREEAERVLHNKHGV